MFNQKTTLVPENLNYTISQVELSFPLIFRFLVKRLQSRAM